MGASSTGLKSNRGDVDGDQPQVIVPRLSVQDIENNNNHIFVNPQDNQQLNFLPLHALIDECDYLNNNTTLINNNYLTVSLTSPSSTTLTTATCNNHKLNNQHTIYRLSDQQIQSATNVKESPRKSPKKKVDEKLTKKEKKKKDKPKPKPPRAKTGGAGGGGGGRGRGMAEQDQMMRRPRRTAGKEEK